MNKRGVGTAYVWIYGLVSLFALGILYVVFDQVFLMYLIPTMKNNINMTGTLVDQGTVSEIYYNYDKFMDFWHIMPFVLFFVIIIYMIIMGIRRERNDEYV